MKPYTCIRSLAFVGLALCMSCGGGGGGGGNTGPLQGQVVVSGLSFPTALRFTPDGDILVTEKSTGNVRKVVEGVLQPNPIFNVSVNSGGERGLLGLAVDPNYASNKFVYIFYTKSSGTENEILRFTDDGVSANPTVIVPNLPASSNHDGGKLDFGPDGKLYVTLGDVQDPANSQNDSVRPGKVLRYNPDGTIPGDNPIAGNPMYSKGHRNCFGLAIDQDSGQVFVSENGPNCDDEVNRVAAGGNYGWRPSQPCGDTDPAYAPALVTFSSVIAPTGLAVGSGAYEGSLLMASFNDRSLRRITINNFPSGTLASVQVIYNATGELILDVTMGPDGNPYIATDNRILRLVN